MRPEGFHFADPFWLYGILLLPVIAAFIYWTSRAKYSTFFVGNPRLVQLASKFFSVQLVPWFLRLLVLALCLFAAARPQERARGSLRGRGPGGEGVRRRR